MRLFFLQPVRLALDGSSVSYEAGKFYIVDDLALANGFCAQGSAESEQDHFDRLRREDEARAAAEAARTAAAEEVPLVGE